MTPLPAAPKVLDARLIYDAALADSEVLEQNDGTWILLSHAAVTEAANRPDIFSSDVSRFLQIPNGLDGDKHAKYRSFTDRFLTDDDVAELEPRLEAVAQRLLAEYPSAVNEPVEAVMDLGLCFAVHAQVEWLGWSKRHIPALISWVKDHRAAVASGVSKQIAAVSSQFDSIVMSEVRRRHRSTTLNDVTARLVSDASLGQPLPDEYLVSILRNWTAGDLSSLAASFGVIVYRLVTDDQLRAKLSDSQCSDAYFDLAIDEILRIDDPFLSSRRITTKSVTIRGETIPAGSRVILSWVSANRDPQVFSNPDEFAPEKNAEYNLVYGIGPHVCPGRALATMELRVITKALLTKAPQLRLAPVDGAAKRSTDQVGGYSSLMIEW